VTIIVTYDVQCENPSCLAWIHGEAAHHGHASIRGARREAAKCGWVRRRIATGAIVDLCPAHAGWSGQTEGANDG
jgi:hypothetical protein